MSERGPAGVEPPDVLSDLPELAGLDLVDDTTVEDARVTSLLHPIERVDRVIVSGCRLSNLELTGTTFRSVRLDDVVIERGELSGVTFEASTFERVRFEDCRMSGFVAPQLTARNVSFAGCRMDQSWLRMAVLERCSFEDCDLADADFYTARVADSRFVRCTLDRTEWSDATLTDVAFHGSTLDDARGGAAFRDITVGSDQIVPFALAVFRANRIVVDDDYLDGRQG